MAASVLRSIGKIVSAQDVGPCSHGATHSSPRELTQVLNCFLIDLIMLALNIHINFFDIKCADPV